MEYFQITTTGNKKYSEEKRLRKTEGIAEVFFRFSVQKNENQTSGITQLFTNKKRQQRIRENRENIEQRFI